jgi:hypothetical protein
MRPLADPAVRSASYSGVGERETRVLFIYANPLGQPQLQIDRDLKAIKEAIRISRREHRVDMREIPAASITDFRRSLFDNYTEPSRGRCIVHFAGHGTQDGFTFVNESQRPETISPALLGELLAARGVQTAVFASCHAAAAYENLPIQYCVAMHGSVDNNAAREFTRGFYDAIAAGGDIPLAFEEGMAAARAHRLVLDAVLWIDGKLAAGIPPRGGPSNARRARASTHESRVPLIAEAEPGFSVVLLALRHPGSLAFTKKIAPWVEADGREWVSELEAGPAVVARVTDPGSARTVWEKLRTDTVATIRPSANARDVCVRRGPRGFTLSAVNDGERTLWAGVHPVTEQEYAALGYDPDGDGGHREPRAWWPASELACPEVESWLSRLNARVGSRGRYRLPTAAEWRQMSEDLSSLSPQELAPMGWLAVSHRRDVGMSVPNRWGLLDLIGNVAEWTGGSEDGKRFVCGGAYDSAPSRSLLDGERAAETSRSDRIGFRVVWEGAL